MILVDTSIWIEYFRGNTEVAILDSLIDTNNICINDLILAELIPSINHKKEIELRDLLYSVTKLNLNINWIDLVFMQTENLKYGINKVGIPDLIIAQNAIMHNIKLFCRDAHFSLMSPIHGIQLFQK
jgi:predicted nucleic acid-binding protein